MPAATKEATKVNSNAASTRGCAIAAKNYYRPIDPAVAAKYADTFKQIPLVTIADFGGWPKAQAEFFDDGGVFDQIYQPGQQ